MRRRLILGLWISCAGLASGNITLDGYLTEVRQKHTGYRGAVLSSEGALARSKEGETLLSFTLFADGEYVLDKSPKITVIQGTKTEYQSYNLGIKKQTDFGLSGKLFYNLNHTYITGLTPLPIPGFTIPSDYYDARPAIELSYSLLRNAGGQEVRSQIDAFEADALSKSHAERFRAQVIEAEAEVAYWRLALARDALSIQRDSVERAKKIRDWNNRRVKMRLADESDLLQSESGWKLRELELQQVADEERSAALNFNSLRGIDDPTVKDDLTSLVSIDVATLKPPPRAERRQDVEAAFQGEKAAIAAAQASIEKNRPNLDLYTALSLIGRDSSLSNSVGNSFHTDQPIWAVGARLSVPLDLSLLAETRRGYEQEAKGAELKYQRKLFEQDKEWNDYNQRYEEVKSRLNLAQEIEEVQHDKFLHEKERQTLGRSTTFLVLQFEQDLAASQFKRLSLQAELLTLIAQMKTFSPLTAGGVQ